MGWFDGVMPITAMKGSMWEKTVPGQQELIPPRTALSSGLISERCERNVGSDSSDVPLKCGNIYLPHKADRQKQTIILSITSNITTGPVSQHFVIFWLHLTKLLVQFPG